MLLTGDPRHRSTTHLTPGAVVWHNHDRKDVDARENMASVAMLGQLVSDVSFEERYCSATPDGFVLQFVDRTAPCAAAARRSRWRTAWS